MKNAVLTLITTIFLASIFLIAPQKAHACSCLEKTTEKGYEDSDFVFQGKAGAIESVDILGYPYKKVHFVVDQVWKGNLTQKDVTVSTASDSAACGFNFEEGVEYVVFGQKDDNQDVNVSLCSNTVKVTDSATVIEQLKEISQPKPATESTNETIVKTNLKEEQRGREITYLSVLNTALICSTFVVLVVQVALMYLVFSNIHIIRKKTHTKSKKINI